MSKSVLLAMDFQQGIVERSGHAEVLDPAARAIEAARDNGIPVMFVRVAFRPGLPEVAASNLSFGAMKARGDAMTQEHEATQIHDAVKPRPDEPIIIKRRISAFSGSDLDVLLRASGADTLVLCGISTSGVVLSTLRQAADLDYRLVVLADACADGDAEVHRVLTEKVFPRQATVLTADAWIQSLG
jgi:nicotinamidase-related amidase